VARPRLSRLAAAAAAALVAAGPASAGADPDPVPADRLQHDPWEPLNRRTFWLNEQIDRFALEPLAIGWDFVLPDRVQISLRGVYDHLRLPVIAANDALQLKPVAVAEDIGRFAINTLWGLMGIWDAAAMVGLEANDEDFGQTLGYWGVPPGPYLVLPLFGPSSPRDTLGLGGDAGIGYGAWFAAGIPIFATASMTVVDVVNRRSLLLDEIRAEREAAFDWYVFVRNAYLQNRERRVQDLLEEDGGDDLEEDLYEVDEESDEDDLYEVDDEDGGV